MTNTANDNEKKIIERKAMLWSNVALFTTPFSLIVIIVPVVYPILYISLPISLISALTGCSFFVYLLKIEKDSTKSSNIDLFFTLNLIAIVANLIGFYVLYSLSSLKL